MRPNNNVGIMYQPVLPLLGLTLLCLTSIAVSGFELQTLPTKTICSITDITLPALSTINITQPDSSTPNITEPCLLNVGPENPNNHLIYQLDIMKQRDGNTSSCEHGSVQVSGSPPICESGKIFGSSNHTLQIRYVNTMESNFSFRLEITAAPVHFLSGNQSSRIEQIHGEDFGYVAPLQTKTANYTGSIAVRTEPRQKLEIDVMITDPLDCGQPEKENNLDYLLVKSNRWQSKMVLCGKSGTFNILSGRSMSTQNTAITHVRKGNHSMSYFLLRYKVTGCTLSDVHDTEKTNIKWIINNVTSMVVNLMCREGYILDNHRESVDITCLMDTNTWDYLPKCEAIDCHKPDRNLAETSPGIQPFIPTVSYNRTTFGSSALYSCLKGYMISPRESLLRVCQANGTWSGTSPKCQEVVCPPITYSNGFDNNTMRFDAVDLTVGSSASMSCRPGYINMPALGFICNSTGGWSVNQQQSKNKETVGAGEKQENSSLTLKCVESPCGDIIRVSNGVIRNITGEGRASSLQFDCEDGYVLEGNRDVYCNGNLTWGAFPICTKSKDSPGEAPAGAPFSSEDIEERMTTGLTGIVIGSVLLVSIVLIAIIIAILREKKKGNMENLGPSTNSQNTMTLKSIKNKYKQRKESNAKEMDSQSQKESSVNAYTIPRQQSAPSKPKRAQDQPQHKHQAVNLSESEKGQTLEYVEILQDEGTAATIATKTKETDETETKGSTLTKKTTLKRQKASFYEQASICRSVDKVEDQTTEQDDHTYAALKRLSKLPALKADNHYGVLEDPAAVAKLGDSCNDVYAELERPSQSEEQRCRDNSIGSYSYIDSDLEPPTIHFPQDRNARATTLLSVQSEASGATSRAYSYIDPPFSEPQAQVTTNGNDVEQGNVNHAYDDVCSEELYSEIRKNKPPNAFEGETYEFVTVAEK